ncbi:MAG: PLDc N-terminal domain-containing protein [Tissierellia bacterium]|nr:PLDc N-terminal domain-containing protein [Tissierellia bacterium]
MAILNMFPILIIMFLGILSQIFFCIWVYKDATKRGENGVLWLLLIIFVPNLLGLLLYFLIGRKDVRMECPNCHNSTPSKGGYCTYCGEPISYEIDNSHNIFAYLGLGTIILVFILGIIGLILFSRMDGTVIESAMGLKMGGLV